MTSEIPIPYQPVIPGINSSINGTSTTGTVQTWNWFWCPTCSQYTTMPHTCPPVAARLVLDELAELRYRMGAAEQQLRDTLSGPLDDGPLDESYQHAVCGFHWHGRHGLDVPLTFAGEPMCPRCTLNKIADALQALRDGAAAGASRDFGRGVAHTVRLLSDVLAGEDA